jgi:hypothetical protein
MKIAALGGKAINVRRASILISGIRARQVAKLVGKEENKIRPLPRSGLARSRLL